MTAVIASCAATVPVRPLQAGDPIQVMHDTEGVTRSRSSAYGVAAWSRGTRDLVFLGRFESWQRDTSRWEAGYRARCRIDSIIAGYSLDSVVVFKRLLRPSFAEGRLRSGTPVLVFLTRRCTITGSSCGDFMIIGNDGTLLSDYISGDQAVEKARDPRPLRVQDLPLEVFREGNIGALIAGCAGVAQAGLTKTPASSAGVWRCSYPTWLISSDESLPTYVHFPRMESCHIEGPPVRYLIPVPRGFRGDTLFVNACPRALRVKDGMSTALGVALPEIQEVVQRGEDGRLRLNEPSWVRRRE